MCSKSIDLMFKVPFTKNITGKLPEQGIIKYLLEKRLGTNTSVL